MSDVKPREFWIKKDKDTDFNLCNWAKNLYVMSYESRACENDVIHVIEKSYADKLAKELEELKAKPPIFIKLDETTEQLSRENAYIESMKMFQKQALEACSFNQLYKDQNDKLRAENEAMRKAMLSVNPYLKLSTDILYEPAVMRTPAQSLRQAADEYEKQEAAIMHFREILRGK